MNKLILYFFSALLYCRSSATEPASLSTFLEHRVSLKCDASSLADAVHQLVGKANNDIVGMAYGIKFIFEDSQKFQSIEPIKFDLKNEKVRRVLDIFGANYRHEVRYDYSNGVVRLVAASGGEDSVRKYFLSKESAEKLSITFASIEKVRERIFTLVRGANLESVDLAERSIVLRGRIIELDYFDMVVTVYGRGIN